ncbi:MAG: YjbQ family protein [Promethearchaeota archaeon]
MIERLYQPDFSCIFGKKYSNAFIYGQVDSLVWPVFTDIESSELLKNFLKLKNKDGRELLYRRKITIEDERVELYSSNINFALIQAMNLGRNYGVSNSDVVNVVKSSPDIFKGVLSFSFFYNMQKENALFDIKKIENEIDIVGIAIYPSFTKLDLTKENPRLKEVLTYCRKKHYFIKIDLGNTMFPDNFPKYISFEKIKSFLSMNFDNIFILSGMDISGDFKIYYQLLKYFNNLWFEIDPRTIGGLAPTDCFKKIFKLKGFVQNAWQRFIIGSATPTLEIPQIVRGFIEATDELPFSQKCILRTWAFRNITRLIPSMYKLIEKIDLKLFENPLKIDKIQRIETQNEVNIIYKIKLRSYSITQLIFLTDIITSIFNEALKSNPNLKNGELLIRTYHTTTSLIINEHEFGNYLDLHYKFAEISQKNNAKFLHTVKALENRADFNHYDHELASTYGSRQLIIPVVNRQLEIGNRENFYILITFGPRTFQLYIRIKLLKEE